MYKFQEGIGPRGAWVPGPPWILGLRGAPRAAPENTASSFALAIALGLDGVHYDLRATSSGELVLLADETLDRTTDGHGALALRRFAEVSQLDAGGWFGKRFLGERLLLVEEALALPGRAGDALPQHWIELAEPGLIEDLARRVKAFDRPLALRVASSRRDVCRAAEALGLPSALLVARATADDLAFARDEHLTAISTSPGGWSGVSNALACAAERWSRGVDAPSALLDACRAPLAGFSTTEPERALAIRALCALAPQDRGAYPLEVAPLEVSIDRRRGARASWWGDWRRDVRVRNPFGFRVRVALELRVRRGVFESEGLPAALALAPGEVGAVAFRVRGGSWSPGGDPLILAHFSWPRGPGRPAEGLTLDLPLERVRRLTLGSSTERLTMLTERPGDAPASIHVRRRGGELLLALENSGGLVDAHLVAHLDGATVRAGQGLRLRLPRDFGARDAGIPFSAGIEGRERGALRLRRWAGGLPNELEAGVPGRLTLDARA